MVGAEVRAAYRRVPGQIDHARRTGCTGVHRPIGNSPLTDFVQAQLVLGARREISDVTLPLIAR